MTEVHVASGRITQEVTSWPGVQAGPGRRGEFAFGLGRREIGHLHVEQLTGTPARTLREWATDHAAGLR